MQEHLLTSAQWAEQQFGSVDLADERRTKRLIRVAASLTAKPRGTLPAAMASWKELKAAYRLFDNEAVSFEQIAQPHWLKTRQCCSQPGQYLLIEDTTLLDYSSHHHLAGIGRIGDDGGRGINLHTTLALRVHHWKADDRPEVSVVGIAGQHRWVRAEQSVRKPGVRHGFEPKKDRFGRQRESQRWAQVLCQFPASEPDNQRIYIADRESDIYEAFDRCDDAGFDFVIRACQNRALMDAQESLAAAVQQQPEMGRYNLVLRARPGSPARTAIMSLRAMTATLRPPYRPKEKLQARQVTVIEAREVGQPAGKEPLRWLLLTSLPCQSYQQTLRVIQLYTCRWVIEEYHKALKTGVGIEESQLQERHRLEALLGILSVVAVRLLGSKLAAAECPDEPVRTADIAPEAMLILEAQYGKPKEGWTQKSLWRCIARLGGFLARKSDGEPGWQTTWRGWNQLMLMTKGAQILKEKCG